jgi:hypothetical protein
MADLTNTTVFGNLSVSNRTISTELTSSIYINGPLRIDSFPTSSISGSISVVLDSWLPLVASGSAGTRTYFLPLYRRI